MISFQGFLNSHSLSGMPHIIGWTGGMGLGVGDTGFRAGGRGEGGTGQGGINSTHWMRPMNDNVAIANCFLIHHIEPYH